MELGSNTDWISLTPVGYEFPESPASQIGGADWLVVAGEVSDLAERWSFQSASMTALEAAELGSWLLHVAAGTVPETPPDESGWIQPTMTFMEPALGFSVQSQTHSEVILRVHLGYECGPPSILDDDRMIAYKYVVVLQLNRIDLLEAASTWNSEIAPFPHRGRDPAS